MGALSNARVSDFLLRSPPETEKVFLRRFGTPRHGKKNYRKDLLESPHLLGKVFEHESGALLILHPHQIDPVSRELDAQEVHPFHMAVAESLDVALENALKDFS